MLVLSRHVNGCIRIGDEIIVKVVDIRGDKIRLGIEAPKELSVHRQEVFAEIWPDKPVPEICRPLDPPKDDATKSEDQA